MALNGIISRRISAFAPAVISIGSMHGGQTENVIPARLELTGTLRYTESRVQRANPDRDQACVRTGSSIGGNYQLHFEMAVLRCKTIQML